MGGNAILVIVVITALAFDFTNGFHDTANVVATAISTRALAPQAAIGLAAVLNFAGAFMSLSVAATIATGIVDPRLVTETTAFAGLLGAITWNLITWGFGLPSSSSHALVGGIVGAVLQANGGHGVKGEALVGKIIIPAIVSPILAFSAAGLSIVIIYRIVGRRRPGSVKREFRYGQIVSSGMLALAHGTNDAQKTMGVMTLALVAHGSLSAHNPQVPDWVVVLSATAIALGTYAGGWRIIRTLGTRIIKVDVAQGFAAQSAGAAVILASSHYGYPLSSTHVTSGGIVGAGAAKRFPAVRSGIAGNIVRAWVLTLPAAALLGGAASWMAGRFGSGSTGPMLLRLLGLALLATLAVRRRAGLQMRPQGVR